MTTNTSDETKTRTRRRRTMRRLGNTALYAAVRGGAAALGGGLITGLAWLITHW